MPDKRKRACPGCGQIIPTWRMICPMYGERVYRTLIERERKVGEVSNVPTEASRNEIVDIPEEGSKEKEPPTLPVKLLGTALRTGKLKAFIQSEKVTYKELEARPGISYGMLIQWANDHIKVPKSEVTQILSALDAG